MTIAAISSDHTYFDPMLGMERVRAPQDVRETGAESRNGFAPVTQNGSSPDFTVTLSAEAERLANAEKNPGSPSVAPEEAPGRTRAGADEAVPQSRDAGTSSGAAVSAQAGTMGLMSAGVLDTGSASTQPLSQPLSNLLEPGADKGIDGVSGGMEARSADRAFLGGVDGGSLENDNRLESGSSEMSDNPSAGGEGRGQSRGASAVLSEDEKREVEELKKRDREVRAHEQAHMSAGAATGGARYQTTTGPDGRSYAVGGSVPISISEGSSPEQTMANARSARAAALAPAEPSAQDRQVAAKAAQMETAARQEKTLDQGGAFGLSGLFAVGEAEPMTRQRLMEKAARAYERVSGVLSPAQQGGGVSAMA